mgnify:CR=1 FL=1
MFKLKLLSLFAKPITRHITAGVVILLIVFGGGWFLGYKFIHKKLDKAETKADTNQGKYEELQECFDGLEERYNLMQESIIEIAKQERIRIQNQIQDVKVKDGSDLNFSPVSKAELEIPPEPKPVIKLKPKKPGFFRRLFSKKNKRLNTD